MRIACEASSRLEDRPRAVRHRGTVCGSLAHAHPAVELPMLALVALDAELIAAGPEGTRVIPARDFFVSMLTARLGTADILTKGPAFGFLTSRNRRYTLLPWQRRSAVTRWF